MLFYPRVLLLEDLTSEAIILIICAVLIIAIVVFNLIVVNNILFVDNAGI